MDVDKRTTIDVARDLLVAYLGVNTVDPDVLPTLMKQVHDTVVEMQKSALPLPTSVPQPVPQAAVSARVEEAVSAPVETSSKTPPRPERPAVPIEQSVRPDAIICLEDGKECKMLKRYLRTHFNLTPEQYRDRWGLPLDYPMVCEEYSNKKRIETKLTGLGKKEHREGKARRARDASPAEVAAAKAEIEAKQKAKGKEVEGEASKPEAVPAPETAAAPEAKPAKPKRKTLSLNPDKVFEDRTAIR